MTEGIPRYLSELLGSGGARSGERRAAAWAGFDPARARSGEYFFSQNSARGIPAFYLAARIAAEAVARLRLTVWRGTGADRRKVPGAWQALLFAAPNSEQTRFEFWEAVEESLTLRGNAFVWKLADDRRVRELWALHPDQVEPHYRGGAPAYRVRLGGDFVDPLGSGSPRIVTVDKSVILHIRGPGGGGRLVAPSPIQLHRRALAAAAAKASHEEMLYSRGASYQLGVEFPAGVPPETLREFRKIWDVEYGQGPASAGKTPVIGGGAKFARIGLSQADAQFVEAMNFSVEEIARITNVQASLLGVMRSGRPLSPEHEEDRWHRYGLGPRLERIESALEADPDLFGPGTSAYPRFEVDNAVRGDLQTEEMLAHQQIQDGRLLVDEWRAAKGLPPLPGGVGSIPQIVPVGGAPNPVSVPAAPATPATNFSDGEDT